jgi:hypothetical protein
MLLSDADKPLEGVFTAFGYAAFWAFMWEAELAALALTLKRIREPKLTASELDQYDAETRKKHVGQILDKELGELLKEQPDLKQFCVNITDSRNRLMHRFYEEQLPLLVTNEGKKRSEHELELIANELRAGCAFIKKVYMQLAHSQFDNVDSVLSEAHDRVMKLWKT